MLAGAARRLLCVVTLDLGCTEGEARLVGGDNLLEGRVEICLNNEWGTVCDQMWNDTNTGVVCGQLGLIQGGRRKMMIICHHQTAVLLTLHMGSFYPQC